jgi:hypothetical protein
MAQTLFHEASSIPEKFEIGFYQNPAINFGWQQAPACLLGLNIQQLFLIDKKNFILLKPI